MNSLTISHPVPCPTPPYLKDTTDLLQEISQLGHLPPGGILVTLNVFSHNHPSMLRVRKLAEESWIQESWTHQQLSTAQLVQMIEEMVTLSKYVLNGVNYLWIQGTAMDTGMASPCANLFMAELCRRTCSTGQQQNRAYGGDTLMMSLQSGTMAKYTTDTSLTIPG